MDHDHSHHDHENMACDGGMMMVFHINVCQEILFSGWVTRTGLEVFYSCLAVFVTGFLYEALTHYTKLFFGEANHFRPVPRQEDTGLKYTREAVSQRGGVKPISQVNIAKNECGPGSHNNVQTIVVRQTILSRNHFLQTGLHTVQTTLSYMLMLVFMTYHVWLCLALVLGMTLGYFIFGWRKQSVVDVNEHCQ